VKTEEILRYDRMYRAMLKVLDAEVIAFDFWIPTPTLTRRRAKDQAPGGVDRPPYERLSGGHSL
jgi:hypothetical protein